MYCVDEFLSAQQVFACNQKKTMTAWHFNNLLKRLSSGDMSALEQLFNEYYPKAYAVARLKLKSGADAHDIASDVIVKLCGLAGMTVKNPDAYVYTMTVNLVRDFQKQSKPLYVADLQTLDSAVLTNYVSSHDVMDLLSSLAETDKEIFCQHVFYELTFAEIAKNLNLSVATVKRHYAKSCKQLQSEINDCGK